MKKLVALFISTVLSISVVTTAFAGVEDRAFFLSALKATSDQIKKESALIEKADKSSSVMQQLVTKFPFEAIVEAGFTSESESLQPYNNLKGKVSTKYDLVESKYQMQIDYNIPRALAGSPTDIQMDMKVFSDGSQFAINMPKVSDNYYAIAQTVTADQWNESPIGQHLPMDEATLEMLKYSLGESVTNIMGMLPSLADKEQIKDIYEPYTKILTNFVNKGTFKAESNGVVDTSIGSISTRKTSVTFTEEQMRECLDAFSEELYNDERLRAYLNAAYGSLSAMSDVDLTETYLDAIKSALTSVDLPEWMVYTIYTNSTNKILRHELCLPGYADTPILMTLDTIGNPYLLDEIYLTVKQQDETSTNTVKLSITGNFVPQNGVFTSDVSLKAFSEIQGRSQLEVLDLLRASYTVDMNNTEDNFKMQIHIGRFSEGYTVEKPYDVNININGDYAIDEAAKSVTVNLKDIRVQTPDADMNMYMNVTYQQADSADISVPADQLVNLIDLTDAEIESMQKELTKVLGSLN